MFRRLRSTSTLCEERTEAELDEEGYREHLSASNSYNKNKKIVETNQKFHIFDRGKKTGMCGVPCVT
jgi:hypothetical protein